MMPGRKFRTGSVYRYGFNGKENDNDVKGEGNQQDYGMRIYDPRLGRFLSEDPLTQSYPELTPYQYASNRPVDGTDLDGLEYTPAGRYGINQIAVDATAVRHYEASPLVLKKQVENAPERMRQEIRKQPIPTQPTIGRYKAPDPIQAAKNKTLAAAHKATHPEPTKLEKNVHFQKFAEKLAIPLIEGAAFDGLGRIAVKETILLFEGYAAKKEIQIVYRVFGGDSRAEGFSWTPINPNSVKDFRNLAGLPSGGASGSTNTAEFMIKGEVKIKDILKAHPAEPLDGNIGGLPEFKIDPKNVKITGFKVLKP